MQLFLAAAYIYKCKSFCSYADAQQKQVVNKKKKCQLFVNKLTGALSTFELPPASSSCRHAG